MTGDKSHRRNFRRLDSDVLTDVNQSDNRKQNRKSYVPRDEPPPSISTAQFEAVDHTINEFDRDVIGLYLNRSPDSISANTLISEETVNDLSLQWQKYPFWATLTQADKESLKSLYLDYFMANLLSRAYNEVLLLLRDDQTDYRLIQMYHKKRLELLHRKDFLDDALIYSININMSEYKEDNSNYKFNADDDVGRALRDIVNDLEMVSDSDPMDVHFTTLSMIHTDAVKHNE